MKYEMRVVLDNGRVIPGPIFNAREYDRFKDIAKDYDKASTFRLRNGHRYAVIPEDMIQRSYVEIRRIGLLKRIIRRFQ